LKIFFHSELQPSKSKFVHIYKIPGNILHNTGALLLCTDNHELMYDS